MENRNISRVAFKHNFLKHIIMRLDFQGVLQAEIEDILIKVKPYLKSKQFNRYEQKITNEINIDISNSLFQTSSPVKEISNITIHSFMNETSGYTIDLSTNFVILKVGAIKYIPFEEYSQIFMDIVNIYKDTIDFFTVKRFGLRKINFCFVKSMEYINKYFNETYFDCDVLFDDSRVLASEKRKNLVVDKCKMNLLCAIEQGQLGSASVYKISLDTDIYIDKTEDIEQLVFCDNDTGKLNDRLFAVYIDALSEEFGQLLMSEDTTWNEDIIGVEKNE